MYKEIVDLRQVVNYMCIMRDKRGSSELDGLKIAKSSTLRKKMGSESLKLNLERLSASFMLNKKWYHS